MAAYYNEIDAYAAEWLRNLIKAGNIADGEVDTRSIVDVQPDDLREFTQCHFFAGIAGWSYALRLAGWEDERQIWTGSCPCQPFSVAGQGKGVNDERHLWPHFFRLIRGCRPPVVMGEQVAGAAGYGWLDGVRSDLESEDYSCQGVDIAACSVNAPHIRQRLYWIAKDMAHSDVRITEQYAGDGWKPGQTPGSRPYFEPSRRGELVSVYVEHTDGSRQAEHGGAFAVRAQQSSFKCAGGDTHDMADADSEQLRGGHAGELVSPSSSNEGEAWERQRVRSDVGADGDTIASNVADAATQRRQCEQSERPSSIQQVVAGEREIGEQFSSLHSGVLRGYWHDAIWLNGADGKTRRAQPDICLLAHGVPARVGKLRAYGNAIVPPLAAEAIKAFMETL